MRLPNVKMLLCWPSRIFMASLASYGFVENHTFLEQFVRMGVPAHFLCISLVHVFLYNFWIIRLHWLLICMITIRYKSMGGEPPASSESRPLVIEHSE